MPTLAGKKRLFSIITAALSLSVILISGEMLVRFFLPFNTPDTLRRRSLQYIPSIFSRNLLKPMQMVEADSSTARSAKEKDGGPHKGYFINTAGYRGPDFAITKPKGITRIVIVGGSSAFDVNSKDSNDREGTDWPHFAERLLKKKGFENIELINAGIPGHASFDSLGRLYSQLWIYEPDYVLLYNSWNDIKYFRKLTPENPLISLIEPDEKPNPFLEYQGWWDRLLSHSQLYVKFRNQYYGWKFPVDREGVIAEGEYQDAFSSYAVRQYRLNVELFADACRNIGATPIFLTEATLVSPNNSAEERKLIGYHYQLLTHSALVKALEETYQVIRSIGQEKQVAVLDITKEFNGHRELFTDHVHLTARGSEQLAKRVAEFMVSFLEGHRPKPKTKS